MSAARQQSSPERLILGIQQAALIFGVNANFYGDTVTNLEEPHAG